MPSAEIISYLAAAVTAMVGWYLAESIRYKNKADAAKSIAEAATNMVDQKDEEIHDMKTEIRQYKLYVLYLINGIYSLHLQIDDEPIFIPKSLEEFISDLK